MRPRTVDKIAKAVEERPEQLARAREREAKVVGYFCSYMPEEIIHALGLIAVRLGRGGNDDLVELGGQYISTDNCVFLRQSVGLFADGKDSFASQCDHVAVAASCIQMYRNHARPGLQKDQHPGNFYCRSLVSRADRWLPRSLSGLFLATSHDLHDEFPDLFRARL